MTHEEYVELQRSRVVAVAEGMIAGTVGIIAGSRILTDLRYEVEIPGFAEDFLVFVGIESETDDLPVGEVREYWSPKALKEKDVEIERCESLYRQPAIEACGSIIRRFKKAL